MFLWKNRKFYHYFNADKNKDDVLCKNTIINYGNIIIARLTNAKTFVFAKLTSIEDFIVLFSQCNQEQRTFYSVIIGNYRYLYIDIDYKLSTTLQQWKKNHLIKTIVDHLRKFNLSTQNTYCPKISYLFSV